MATGGAEGNSAGLGASLELELGRKVGLGVAVATLRTAATGAGVAATGVGVATTSLTTVIVVPVQPPGIAVPFPSLANTWHPLIPKLPLPAAFAVNITLATRPVPVYPPEVPQE